MKKNSMTRVFALSMVVFHLMTFSVRNAFADGWNVVDSKGNVVSQTDGNNTTVNVVDGNSYTVTNGDIAAGQTVNINVINNQGLIDATSKAIFDIKDGAASNWSGNMNLTGIAAFLNAYGFNITDSFQGNVTGGAILSTMGIDRAQFFAGVAELARGLDQDTAAIFNKGQFNIAENSFLALVAGAVRNDGKIFADGGAVVLAAGDQVKMDITGGNGLISVAVDKAVDAPVYDFKGNKIADQITNTGSIKANGGLAILTAKSAEQIFDNVINHSGIVEANTLESKHGQIILDGGDQGIVNVTGTLNAKGDNVGETGGKVEVLGDKVGLFGGATVDVSGYNGGGTALIGGDYQGLGSVHTSSAVYVDPFAVVNADAILDGNGGKIIVWGNNSAQVHGILSAKGGELSGDGGLIETSSKNYLDVEGVAINAGSQHGNGGTWLVDPRNVDVVSAITNGGGNQQGSFSAGGTWTPNNVNNNAEPSQILASQIKALLDAGTNVTLNTTAAAIAQAGTISILAAITKTNGNNANLTLNATAGIILNALISSTSNFLNVVLNANGGSIIAAAAGTITTNGGNFTASATTDITLSTVNAGTGNVTVTADSDNNGVNTLLANSTISGKDIILQGTSAGNNEIINLKGDVSGETVTIRRAATVDLADNVDLTATNGAVAVNSNVGTINLSGANGTTNILSSTGGNNSIAALTATNNANLTLNSTGTITTSSVNINGGTLNANVDTDNNNNNTNNFGALTAGVINVSGTNANDALNFNGNVTTTGNFTVSNGGATTLDGAINSGAGTVDVTGSSVAINGTSTTTSGAQNFTATNTNVTVGNVITTTSGKVTLKAKNDVKLNAATSDITTGGGAVEVVANTDDTGGGDFNQSNTDSAITTNGGQVDVTGDVVTLKGTFSSGAGKQNYTAKNGILDVNNALTSANADINLNATGNINLDTGASNVTTGGGKFTVNADSDDSGAGSFTKTATASSVLTSGGDITASGAAVDINGVLNSGAGNIALTGKTTTVKVSNALTTTGGNVTLTAKTDVAVDNAKSTITTGGGSFTVKADSDANNTGIFDMNNNAGASVNTGAGTIDITASDIALTGTLTTTGVAKLKTSTAGRTIGLGGGTGNYALTDAEGDKISAGTLEIGQSNAGDIKVGDFSPNGTSKLILRTGGSVTETGAGDAGADLTVADLGIDAATGVNVDVNVTNLGVKNSTSGAIDVTDTAGGMTVNTITNSGTTINGVTNANGGNIALGATGAALGLNDNVSTTGDVALTAGTTINQTGGTLTANDASFNAGGAVTINQTGNSVDSWTGTAGGDVNLKDSVKTAVELKAITAVGKKITYFHDGTLTDTVNVTGNITSGSGAVNGGNIDLKSSGLMTVNSTISSAIGSGGILSVTGATINVAPTVGAGNVTLTALGALDTIINAPINSAINVILNAVRDIILQSSITTTGGANVTLNADSDNNGVGGIWLQNGSSINSDGDITLNGSAINDAGAAGESLRIDAGATLTANGNITLGNGGFAPAGADVVINGTVTTNGSGKTITVNSKDALTTSNDGVANLIGDNIALTAGDDIDVEINGKNASLNTTTGDISVEDMAGGLNINGFSNPGTGILTIITHSPLTIAADLIQAATINLTAGESGAAGDDLTVNNGITVESTGGDVNLSAGDNVTLNAASVVKSDTGTATITITAGSGDTDGAGSISLGGLVSGDTVNLNAAVGSISNTNGATNDISGNFLNATAATGIDVDTTESNLSISNTGAGDINIDEADGVNVTNVSAANGSATVTTATGDLNVTTVSASATATLTATTGTIVDSNGAGVNNVTAATLNATAPNGIDLDTTVTDLSASASAGNIKIREADGINLTGVTASGTFDLTTNGAITDSGDTVVGGTTTLDSTSNDITLDSANNDFNTVKVTTGNDVTLNDKDDLDLGASTVSGNLNVTTTGTITESGVVSVNTAGKTATFAAGSGNNITLDTQDNLFKTVAITSGNDVKLKDADSLDLGASTVSGLLNVTTAGDITDSGAVAVTGTTTFTAGSTHDITLDDNNDFNTVSVVSANNASINDVDDLDLGTSTVSGNLNVATNGGALTDSGNVAVTGTTTIDAGAAGNVTLDNANDFGGTVTVNAANNVTLKDINDLTVANLSINGALDLTADSDNNTAGSTLTTGTVSADSVNLSGGTDLDDNINLNGDVTATAGGITVQNAAVVTLADSVDLTATGGAIAVATNIAQIVLGATGTNIFTTNTNDAITLGVVNGTGANLTVTSDKDVTLGNVNLGTGNLTVDVDNNDDGGDTGIFNDLIVNNLSINGHNATSADENFTFNGIINISGDLNMGGVGILTFNNDVTAKSITLHDISNRLQLGDNVDLTSNNGVISVFNNVNSILLAGANGTTNIFDGNGDATVNLSATNGISATNNPNLTVNSEGDVTLSGVNIGTGTLTVAVDNDSDTTNTGSFGALTAGTISAGGTSDDNLDFTGAVTANTAGVTVSNANNVGFDSTINTATTLTQTVGTGTTTFSGLATVGSNADITTGSIAFNGATGSINANAGTGAVKLTAQTGGITSGTAPSDVTAGSLEAQSANGIDLDTVISNLAFNNTAGAVNVRNTGALTINNVGALATSSNTGTTTTLSAASPLTFAVNTTSAGDLTATAGESAGSDDLTVNAGVTVKSTGGDVVLRAGDDVNLVAGSTTQSDTGNVTLTSGFGDTDALGSITLGGVINAFATATITALQGSVNGGGLVTANTADIDAVTEIGGTTALNTAVSTITADSTSGNIDINNNLATDTTATSLTTGNGTINFDQTGNGNLNVTTATTTDGTITITADNANLNATTVTAGGSGNVALTTTTSGNVNVDNVTASGNDITVTSAGAIEELGADSNADLTSDTMTLSAANGIGAAGTLEIDATTLTSANVSGTGAIDLQDVATGVVVTNATTNDGAITINAIGGDLTATNVVAGGVARNVNLSTTTSGNILLGTVTAAGDTATINSVGNINGINGANITTANTIDLDAVSGIGNNVPLNTAASFISADSTNGAIDINNNLTTTTEATSLTTGNGTINFDQTGGGDLTVDLATTGNGDITLTNAGGDLTAVSVTAGAAGAGDGNIQLTTTTAGTSGDVFVGNVTALDDTVNVNSVGEIQDTDGAGTDTPLVANITAGTINLYTNGGNIGATTNYLDIQPSTIWNAGTLGGDLYVNCIGVCPTGVVDLGTGNGYLTVGTLVDANDDLFGEFAGGAVNLIAGGFEIRSTNGIGQDLGGGVIDGIEMQLHDFGGASNDGRFIATGGTGVIYASNKGTTGHGLALDTMPAGILTNVTADDVIEILSGSPLTIAVDVIGGANITLSALGTADADDVILQSNKIVSSTGAGDVLVTSGDSTFLYDGSSIRTTGTGTVTVAAGEDYTDFTLNQDGYNAAGDVDMNATSSIRSQDGDILVDALRSAKISEVNADSNADNTRGDVTVRARFGDVSDRNGASTNVTADHLQIESTTGVADSAVEDNDFLETDINRLNVTNTTSGKVQIQEVAAGVDMDIEKADQQGAGDMTIRTNDGTLTVLAAGVGGFGVSATSGVTHLEANGAGNDRDLVLNNTVTSTTGKIELYSTSRDVTADANGDVTATGGAEIEASALRSITMSDGTIFNANGGGTGGNSGAVGVGIDFDATNGDVTLGSVQTTSTASTSRGDANDAVSINALNGAVIDGGDTDDDIIANSGETQIATANGIGQGNSIDTQIDRLTATNSTANDIDIRETAAGGELNIVQVDQNATTGRVDVETTDGNLTVLSETVGGHTGNGVEAVDGETFLVANGAGADDDLVLNNQVESSTGKINLDSNSRDVVADDEGDVTATGGAEIESYAERNITMSDGTIWNANSGGTGLGQTGAIGVGIDLDANTGDVTLGSVQTTSTAATSRGDANDAVSINALNGAVINGSVTNNNIIANSGETQIAAANGIGHGNSITTQIDRLTADNSTANDIDIREQAAGGALNIVHVDQQAPVGRIDIQTLDGTLTVLTENVGVGAFTANGVQGKAGEVFLRANGAGNDDDLVINNQIETTTGKVNIDSSSNDVIADAEGDITATGGAEIESDALNNITMADGAVWNSNGGGTGLGQTGTLGAGIDLNAQNGNITLGSVQTSSTSDHSVVIVSNNGEIIDGGDTNKNIVTAPRTVGVAGSGGGMILSAKNGIGRRGTGVSVNPNSAANHFATDAIDTQGGRLAAYTQQGDIQVQNTGAMQITTLTDDDAVTPQGSVGAGTVTGVKIDNFDIDTSQIFVTTASPMFVSSDVINLAAGNITLYADNGTVADTLDIDPGVRVSSFNGDGDIRIVSGGSMTMGANSIVSTEGDGVTSGTGHIYMGAGYNTFGKTANEGAVPGATLVDPSTTLFDTVGDPTANFTMDNSAHIWTEGGIPGSGQGDILIDVQNNFIVGRVDADGDAGAGITDGLRGSITTFSRNGSTLDAETPNIQDLNFLAYVLTMFSGNTIGLPNNPIEFTAPYFNAFAINDIFATDFENSLVQMTSTSGNIMLTSSGDILLGYAHATAGSVELNAGGSILAQPGSNDRVSAKDSIQLRAAGVVGTESNPVSTLLLSGSGTLFLEAGSSINNLSANVTGNFGPGNVQFLNTPPGLALFNGIAIGGDLLSGLISSTSQLHVGVLPKTLSQFGQFDGNFLGDFPAIFNLEKFGQPVQTPIDTTGLDAIKLPAVPGVPPVVPIPAGIPAGEQKNVPPAVVPIPKPAQPTGSVQKTDASNQGSKGATVSGPKQ